MRAEVKNHVAQETEYEESTESSEEEVDEALNAQAIADIDQIVKTPKSSSHLIADFLKLAYEEGGRIELPWYT